MTRARSVRNVRELSWPSTVQGQRRLRCQHDRRRCPSFNHLFNLPNTMSDTEATVFLEDVDPTSSQGAKRKASEIDTHATSPNAKTKGVVSTTKKTLSQGTLSTFFSSAGVKSSSQLGTKRLKTESGGPATSPGRSINTQQQPKLNSIPFSLSAYQGSLSEGEKDLLRLECECIGLSW